MLLASQLLQKLIKGVADKKNLITQENVKYVRGYINAMNSNKDTVALKDDCDSEEYLAALVALLDWSSPPNQVLQLCDKFFSKSAKLSHWMISPFKLEKGAKIVEAIIENAKQRHAQSGVLEEIRQLTKELTEKGLLDSETSIVEGNQKKFCLDYGQFLKKCHTVSTSSEAKVLKGNDKATLTSFHELVRTAIRTVQTAFLAFDMTVFVDQISEAAHEKNADKIPTEFMTDELCLIQIQGLFDSKQVMALIQFGKYLETFASKLQQSMLGNLDAVQCQQAAEKWNNASCNIMKTFSEETFLKDTLAKLSTSSGAILQANLGSHASVHVGKCLELAVKASQSDPLLSDSDWSSLTKEFEENAEKASLMSSVMDNGKAMRDAMTVLSHVITVQFGFACAKTWDHTSEEFEVGDAQFKAFASCRELEAVDTSNLEDSLKSLVNLVKSSDVEETESRFDVSSTIERVASLIEQGKAHLVTMRARMVDVAGEIEKPNCEIPQEVVEWKAEKLDAAAVEQLAQIVTNEFAKEKSQNVTDSAVETEEFVVEMRDAAMKMNLDVKDLYAEIETMDAHRRNCLNWLPRGLNSVSLLLYLLFHRAMAYGPWPMMSMSMSMTMTLLD